MQLSSQATSQAELVDDIVTLILQRAAGQRGLSTTTTSTKSIGQYDHAATVLRALAEDVKNIALAGGK